MKVKNIVFHDKSIIALRDDGSLWIRDGMGTFGESEWQEINPPIAPSKYFGAK